MRGIRNRGREHTERLREAEEGRKFRQFLATRGLRMTREREVILDAILDTQEHFDVERLYVELRKRDRFVSRATIYRTLHLLVESGLLDRARFGTDAFSYEQLHGREHHDHMVCNRCGHVIEFVSREIERLQDAACADHDFLPQSHRLTIFGLCLDCVRGPLERQEESARDD
jgi:Fur family ferric uptake transcriptional regulator